MLNKKTLTLLIVVIMLISVSFIEASAADYEFVTLNGEIVINGNIIDSPAPFWYEAEDGETHLMLPLRAIAETDGWDVSWDEQRRLVDIRRHLTPGGTWTASIGIGSRFSSYTWSGAIYPRTAILPTPSVIVGGRTFVPSCFVRLVVVFFSEVSVMVDGQVVYTLR